MSNTSQQYVADNQEYMRAHDIQRLFKECMVQLCTHRPENHIRFLRQHFQRLEQQQNQLPPVSYASEDEDEQVSDLTRTISTQTRERRGAISAEAITEVAAASYVHEVFPKDSAAWEIISKAMLGNVLFSHLENIERSTLIDAMHPIVYPMGAHIITQGDESERFYVIERGMVERFADGKLITTLGPSRCFGELSLIYGMSNEATMIAQTEVKLWSIDRDVYQRIVVSSNMRKRKLYEDLLKQVPILTSLEPSERLTVVDALETVVFKDGETVVEQGAIGEHLFIIIEGSAAVLQQQTVVGRLGANDCFGELALISEHQVGANVTALGPLKCAKLERGKFERVLGPCVDILKRNLSQYKSFISLAI